MWASYSYPTATFRPLSQSGTSEHDRPGPFYMDGTQENAPCLFGLHSRSLPAQRQPLGRNRPSCLPQGVRASEMLLGMQGEMGTKDISVPDPQFQGFAAHSHDPVDELCNVDRSGVDQAGDPVSRTPEIPGAVRVFGRERVARASPHARPAESRRRNLAGDGERDLAQGDRRAKGAKQHLLRKGSQSSSDCPVHRQAHKRRLEERGCPKDLRRSCDDLFARLSEQIDGSPSAGGGSRMAAAEYRPQ